MGVNRGMRSVLLKGPIYSRSGYGEHVRCVFRALQTRPDLYDVYIEPTVWGTTSWSYKDNEENEAIKRCIMKREHAGAGFKANVSLQVMIPNEWQPLAEKNIGVTAGIETDRASAQWVHACNQVDHVVVVSNHAKDVFLKSKHSGRDPNTGTEVLLKCEKTIDVIGYPVKTIEPSPIDLDISTKFNFLTVAQAGPRKCLDATVRWFAEEFKDDEDVGLIIKTNLANNSTPDRHNILVQIKQWIAQIEDKKCKVYLLHGNLSDEEIHYLYNNDFVKAYVTTTHGEGFGLPIYEAAYSGLPVIAPAWSGHVDFLYKTYQKKNGRTDKKCLFNKVKYELQNVQENVLWENVIIPESKWAFSDEKSFKKVMRNVYETHGHKLKMAEELKDHLLENNTEEKIQEKYVDMINKVYPPEVFEVADWLKEIEKNLEDNE